MIRTHEKKVKDRKTLRMLVMITQLGISMMCPVFLCVLPGRWCSERLGHPSLFLLFLLLGIMAGFRSCWQVILRFTGSDLRNESTGLPPKEWDENEESDDKESEGEESDGEDLDKMV